jgi:hypothetical protein
VQTGPTRHKVRHVRLLGVMAVATASLLAGACTSPGTLTVQGPFAIPLPPIHSTAPSTQVPLLGGACIETFTQTDVLITGATVIVPSISLHITGTIDIPNVMVKIPKLTVSLPGVTFKCGSTTFANLVVQVMIPASAFLRDAHLDLTTGVLTLVNPSVTINGVTLRFAGTNLAIDLPITLTIQIPTAHVPLSGL